MGERAQRNADDRGSHAERAHGQRTPGTDVVAPDGTLLWRTAAPSADEPTPWLLLFLLTALAVTLRTIHLNDGLWYDEIRTLQDSVRSPLFRILTVFPGDNQHTFFSLLAHGSMAVFGDHVWSLRLPSALLGAFTIPLLYLFAREFVGRTEALLASLLLAVTYHHIWFSQSARGYATLGFLTVLSSWLLLRGLRRGRLSDFVWYAIAASLGVYTHVTMAFVVASHAALCVLPLGFPTLDAKRLARWKLPLIGFALAGVFSLLLYAPFLLEVKQRVVTKPNPTRNATSVWAALELIKGLRIGLGSASGVITLAILFLIGLPSYLRQSRFVLGMFLLPGVFAIGAAVVLHRPVRPRFVLFLVGFALLVVVRGAIELGRMWRDRRSAAKRDTATTAAQRSTWMRGDITGAGLVLVAAVFVQSAASLPILWRYPKQDFAGALTYVESQRQPHEPILTAGPATYPYASYFARKWQGIKTLDELRQAQASGQRVWVLYTLASYIQSDAPDLMDALRTGCADEHVFRGTLGGGDITVCAMRPVATTP